MGTHNMRDMKGDSGTWGSMKQMNATRNAKAVKPKPMKPFGRSMITGKVDKRSLGKIIRDTFIK